MEKRLGKGLEALIPEDSSKSKEKIANIKIAEIIPNQFQPRIRFETDKMEELKNSIKEKGVIQPVLVRKKDDTYELIAGERRWRAAQELNMQEIPAIIKRDINDVSSFEISLIENLQREELNPIEEAKAYKRLMEQFEYTLEQVGQMVGKDKTTIANSTRLLNLPLDLQKQVEEGILSTGHAKVLLSVTNEYRQNKIAQLVIKNGLSVRQLEQIVRTKESPKKKIKRYKDPDITKIEEELQHKLGTKVNINHGKKRGKLEIQYYSLDDLQRILDIILHEME